MFFYAQSYFKSCSHIYVWKEVQYACPGLICSDVCHNQGIQGNKMLPSALPNSEVQKLLVYMYKNVCI